MPDRNNSIGQRNWGDDIPKSGLFRPRPHLQALPMRLLSIILLFFCVTVWSQPGPEKKKKASEDAADTKDITSLRGTEIEQLIGTLEDPEAREKFLAKLHFLADAREEKTEGPDAKEAQTSAERADPPWSAGVEKIRKVISQGDINHLFRRMAFSLTLLCVGVLIWITLKRYWLKPTEQPLWVRMGLGVALILAICIAVLIVWGVPLRAAFTGPVGRTVTQSIGTIVLATVGGWTCWRVINSYMTKRVYEWHPALAQNRRLQTLLPLFRNIVRVVIITMVVLLVLGELGINIAPLLAGAGVVGIAIGFGAQTLVKDVITGFMVLAEDAINVEDWVVLGPYSGQVEHLTVRHVRLRDIYGNVHVVPWGSVEAVTNQTKNYGYAVFEAGFAYRENIDEVIEVIKKVAAEMQAEPALKKDIWSDLQILGTIELGDSAVVVRTRFRTAPFRRWFLERDFRRRVKNRFDELGIEIPYPHATVYFGENKEGTAPPARVQLHGDAENQTKT